MTPDTRRKGLLLGGVAVPVGLGWLEIDGDQPHRGQPFPWVPRWNRRGGFHLFLNQIQSRFMPPVHIK
jgi:hypothetical protein